MSVALTIHQPWASLIAHGIKVWETRPHPPAGWPGIAEGVRRVPGCRVEPGETVLIHAGTKRPEHLSRVGEWAIHSQFTEPDSGPEIRRLGSVHNGELVPDRHERGLAIPIPLGAVVATARITDVVPIVDHAGCRDGSPHVCLGFYGALAHSKLHEPWPDGETEHDISDQLPYGEWTPGRWAWRLGDVRKLDEPLREYPVPVDSAGCSTSYCFGATGAEMEQDPICKGCNYDGTRMVPVRGRQGVWRPDPALIAACGLPGEAQ